MARLGMPGSSGRKKLREQQYMQLADFDRDSASWGGWSFSFKTVVRGADKDIFGLMEKVEKATADFARADVNPFAEHGMGRVSRASFLMSDARS
jgi:hypothetical protein